MTGPATRRWGTHDQPAAPRRFIYHRMSYEMGRHVIGYEMQKVLAAVDWFCKDEGRPPVGVIGYGEGGLLAFYSGAVDERLRATEVVGAFGPREAMWQEPIYRNVWGLLREFGDAELAALLIDFPNDAPGGVPRPSMRTDRRRQATAGYRSATGPAGTSRRGPGPTRTAGGVGRESRARQRRGGALPARR